MIRKKENTALVVDDHPHLLRIIVSFLRHENYRVHEALSSEAALETINSTPVDAVIADLYLPGKLTGLDVLLQHKKLAPTGCRVLFTGNSSDNIRSVCDYIDVVFIRKPAPLDELVRILDGRLASWRSA